MNIKIIKDSQGSYLTGGEYAILTLEIFVDPNLTPEEQEERVIHAVIENCTDFKHDEIDTLTEYIFDSLLKLREEK